MNSQHFSNQGMAKNTNANPNNCPLTAMFYRATGKAEADVAILDAEIVVIEHSETIPPVIVAPVIVAPVIVAPVIVAPIINTKGDIGPINQVGPMGPTGPTGAKGDVGQTGAAGTTGIRGLIGIKGDPGRKGSKGLDGATGAAPVAINYDNLQTIGVVTTNLDLTLTTGNVTNFFVNTTTGETILNVYLPSRDNNAYVFSSFIGKRIRITHGNTSIHFKGIQPCFLQVGLNGGTPEWLSITNVDTYSTHDATTQTYQSHMTYSSGCIELTAININASQALGPIGINSANPVHNALTFNDQTYISWIATYV